MRCIYCHDRVEDDWIQLGPGVIAHADCAMVVNSRRRAAVRAIIVKTQELSGEDAQRMIRDWEDELEGS